MSLTREEIAEMYNEQCLQKLMQGHEDNKQQTGTMKQDIETTEFELSVKVTNKKITVDCKFPEGHLSGSGSLELVGPYITEALKELQKKVGGK